MFEEVRLLVFGCRKDAATLAALLDKQTFNGIRTSDNAAVYRGFNLVQKCWAHQIRKAINLTLFEPENNAYRRFLDHVLAIYCTARRDAQDKRLSIPGRQHKFDLLTDQICNLCGERYVATAMKESLVGYLMITGEEPETMGDLLETSCHPFAQGRPNMPCLNPDCSHFHSCRAQRLFCIVPSQPIPKTRIWGQGGPGVIIIFEICIACDTIHVTNQCTSNR